MRFRNLELRKEDRRGTSVHNGIFNLPVIQGARDWMSGTVPQHDDLDDYHIIPASRAKELGTGGLINSILNHTLLTAETNRHITRDRYPNEYLPDLMEQCGENAVRSMLKSHFISSAAVALPMRDPSTVDDYEAFIAECQHSVLEAIENLLIQQRIGLLPHLRELDERVERVEPALREQIAVVLGDDAERLPPHVSQKANTRIHTSARKNTNIEVDHYRQVRRRLELL